MKKSLVYMLVVSAWWLNSVLNNIDSVDLWRWAVPLSLLTGTWLGYMVRGENND